MKELLDKMKATLSSDDAKIFDELALKLKAVDGDVTKLASEDINIIRSMEAKYADKLSASNLAGNSKDSQPTIERSYEDFLNSGFAKYVRQLLARDLSSQFPSEEEAIAFAFENKWIAQEFKEPEVAEKIFSDYKEDIGDANQWREDLVGTESDKSMAVGLTWFMVVFQLNKRLNG